MSDNELLYNYNIQNVCRYKTIGDYTKIADESVL